MFAGVMVAVFPGWYMEKFLSDERITNIDLRIKYLEAVTRLNPDPVFFKVLARSYALKGEYDKALEITKRLSQLPGWEIEAQILKYEIKKTIFFGLKDSAKREQIIKDIRNLLLEIAYRSEEVKTLEFVYREGLSMNIPEVSLYAAQKIARKTNSERWIRESVRLAVSMGRFSLALEFIDRLENRDRETYLLKYRILLGAKEFGKALDVLTVILQNYPDLRMKYINDLLWLSSRTEKDISPLLLSLLKEAKGEDRKNLIRVAVNYALGSKRIGLAKRLIERFATAYIEDISFTSFIVKSALATGDPEFAGRVAEEISVRKGLIDG